MPDIDKEAQGPPTISFNYMYLHERSGASQEGTHNPPHLIMIEHKHGRIWAYKVPSKGASAEASWLPNRMVQDLDNNGMKHAKVLVKSDQGPAVAQLQSAMQRIRQARIIPVNSAVGESECNGRAENAIRRVQEKEEGKSEC